MFERNFSTFRPQQQAETMLPAQHTQGMLEAGLDEAGRGCLAGPVVAAAVILPEKFTHPQLNDSKKLSEVQRFQLREVILEIAISWAVAEVPHDRIDQINILNASFEAMHLAVGKLHVKPDFLLVDGNRFRPFPDIPHQCMVKGDGRFLNIAAASVLAKTFRDELMESLDQQHPEYGWKQNKGYPTGFHRKAIEHCGLSPYHRRTFNHLPPPSLFQDMH
jgi:ribonuclease HII